MQQILVISDTHGNQKLMRSVLQQEKGCSQIIHLGDYYEDLDDNQDLTSGKMLTRVPGVLHYGYYLETIPYYQLLELSGFKIICLHDLADMRRISAKADIVLFGHTHKQEYLQKGKMSMINPGHLKSEKDRGYPASYAILEVGNSSIKVLFKDYLCNLKSEFTLNK